MQNFHKHFKKQKQIEERIVQMPMINFPVHDNTERSLAVAANYKIWLDMTNIILWKCIVAIKELKEPCTTAIKYYLYSIYGTLVVATLIQTQQLLI